MNKEFSERNLSVPDSHSEPNRTEAAKYVAKTLSIQCDSSKDLVLLKASILWLHSVQWLVRHLDSTHESLKALIGFIEGEKSFDVDALDDFRQMSNHLSMQLKAKIDWISIEANHWNELRNITNQVNTVAETFGAHTSNQVDECARNLGKQFLNSETELSADEIMDALKTFPEEQKRQQDVEVRRTLDELKEQAKDTQRDIAQLRGECAELNAYLANQVMKFEITQKQVLQTDEE